MSLTDPGPRTAPLAADHPDIYIRFDEIQRPGSTASAKGFHFTVDNSSYYGTNGTKSFELKKQTSYEQMVYVTRPQNHVASLQISITDKDGNAFPATLPDHYMILRLKYRE